MGSLPTQTMLGFPGPAQSVCCCRCSLDHCTVCGGTAVGLPRAAQCWGWQQCRGRAVGMLYLQHGTACTAPAQHVSVSCVLVAALLLGGADPFLILLAAVVIMVLVTISSTASLAGGLSEQDASPACSHICVLLGCDQAAGAAVLRSSCGVAGEQCSPNQVASGHRAAPPSWAPLCCSTVLELPALGQCRVLGNCPAPEMLWLSELQLSCLPEPNGPSTASQGGAKLCSRWRTQASNLHPVE